MDCPGQFTFLARGIKTGMLGRMTAQLYTLPKAGGELIITARPIKIEGKKHFAGSTIFNSKQKLIARAITVWIGLINVAPTS
jgi:acyl-coenzyme A thioesterase PaaI-like protein